MFLNPAPGEPLDEDCVQGKSVLAEAAAGFKSARLRCVAQLYAREWGLPKSSYRALFKSEANRPRLVYSVVGATGRSVPRFELDEVDSELWVTRQSPHRDQNILVCAGARVWLEVAERPRLLMPQLSPEEARGGDDSQIGLLEGRFGASLRTLGVPEEVQLPLDGGVLEPWQPVVVGARPPHVVRPPPSEPGYTHVALPAALGGAAAAYLFARRGSPPGQAPVPPPCASSPSPRSRRIRIRVK
jgi:hypothetical protein